CRTGAPEHRLECRCLTGAKQRRSAPRLLERSAGLRAGVGAEAPTPLARSLMGCPRLLTPCVDSCLSPFDGRWFMAPYVELAASLELPSFDGPDRSVPLGRRLCPEA